ncbi:MAG TPA: peroxiredoxin [Candidatus Kapabacteria bacterium]|nr:peroxiredoxin [Candidatus Kapabacteria bacterium]
MALATELKSGDNAPMFKAESTNGSQISLSDYLGKSNVILYFYPEDMTSGCTVEACHFRDDQSKFKAENTVVLGVSTDSREMHQQFTAKDNLNFPLLVDTSRAICTAYGVPVADNGHAKRWTFLIGKDGKIAKIYHNVNPQVHSDELQNDIADLNKH